MKHWLGILFWVAFWVYSPCFSYRLDQINEIRKELSLSPQYDALTGIAKIKIAVFDNGFHTDEERAKPGVVPSTFELVKSYEGVALNKNTELTASPHGLRMVQVVWGMTGAHNKDKEVAPKIYGMNARGLTHLEKAIDLAIEKQVNIIVYSQTWEALGNGDGTGPVNAAFNKAIKKGILVICNAGNHGKRVYNGPVKLKYSPKKGYYAEFKNGTDVLEFTSSTADNLTSVIVKWPDFTDDDTTGTTRDLDLHVEDEDLNPVKDETDEPGKPSFAGKKIQVLNKEKLEKNETFLPKEEINFRAGINKKYRIRITAKVHPENKKENPLDKFDPRKDRLQIFVVSRSYGDSIQFPDATEGQELGDPASNPKVFTIGNFGPASAVGPTFSNPTLWKPDVVMERAAAKYENGDVMPGDSSHATAYFAGVVANLMTANPLLDDVALRKYIETLPSLNKDSLGANKTMALMEAQARGTHKNITYSILTYLKQDSKDFKESDVRYHLTRDNVYVMVIPFLPKKIQSKFSNLDWAKVDPSEFEFYFAQNRVGQSMTTYIRPVDRQQGKQAPYPWQLPVAKVPDANRLGQWLQVVVNPQKPLDVVTFSDELLKRRWITPSIDEVKKWKTH